MAGWPFPDEPDPQGWDYSINGEWPFDGPDAAPLGDYPYNEMYEARCAGSEVS